MTLCAALSAVPCLSQEEKKPWYRFGKSSQKRDGKANPNVGKLELSSTLAYIPAEVKQLAEDGARATAKGNWFEARELFNQMVLKTPDNPLAYANLGVAEYQLKNYVAAEANLKRSLALEPNIAQNWTTLGLIQFEKRELTLAISSLTRAIHEDPSSAQAHLYLAAVAYDYGWTTAATSELKRVIELKPDHTEAHFNLAMTYLGMKPPKLELARRHYFQAKKLGAEPHTGIERALQNSQ